MDLLRKRNQWCIRWIKETHLDTYSAVGENAFLDDDWRSAEAGRALREENLPAPRHDKAFGERTHLATAVAAEAALLSEVRRLSQVAQGVSGLVVRSQGSLHLWVQEPDPAE